MDKRLKWTTWLGAAALFFMAAVFIAWTWLPQAAIDYLNRPDTAFRQKVSAEAARALGKPVEIGFRISDARMSKSLNLMITLSDIEFTSAALSRFGIRVREAVFEIPLLESWERRAVVVDHIRLDVPEISIDLTESGRAAMTKLFQSGNENADTPTGAGGAEAGRPALRDLSANIGTLRIRTPQGAEEFSGGELLLRPGPSSDTDLTAGLSITNLNGNPINLKATVDAGKRGHWSGSITTGSISLDIVTALLRRQKLADLDPLQGNLTARVQWSFDTDTLRLVIDSTRVENFSALAEAEPIRIPELTGQGEIIIAGDQSPRTESLILFTPQDRIELSGRLAAPLNVRARTIGEVDLERLGLSRVLETRMPLVKIENSRLAVDVDITGKPQRPMVDGKIGISAEQISYRGFALISPKLDGQLSPARFDGDVAGSFFSGKILSKISSPSDFSSIDLAGSLTAANLSDVNAHLPRKDVRLAGRADVRAELRRLSGNLKQPAGTVTLAGRDVSISGLPTFTNLAQSLNDIVDALGKIGEDSISETLGKIKQSTRNAVDSKGTTVFQTVQSKASVSNGVARLEQAMFSNRDMTISATGTVTLEAGALDLTASISFPDPALQKIESAFTRDILKAGIRLPIRGTLMNPVFDKESFLKPLARRAGKKVLEEKLGEFIFKKLERR